MKAFVKRFPIFEFSGIPTVALNYGRQEHTGKKRIVESFIFRIGQNVRLKATNSTDNFILGLGKKAVKLRKPRAMQ